MHASISSSALIFGQKYSSSTEEIIWNAISTGFAVSWFTNLPTGATIVAVLVFFWLIARGIRILKTTNRIEKIKSINQ
jgi:hypothetical protein